MMAKKPTKKQKATINSLIKNAKRYVELKFYDETTDLVKFVLKIDSENSEALNIQSHISQISDKALKSLNSINTELNHLEEKNSRYIELINMRAGIHYDLGMLDQAVSDFTKVISAEPENDTAYHLLGIIKNKLGQYEDAIRDFDEAIKIDPSFSYSWHNRAWSKRSISQYEDAVKDLRQAMSLDPDNELTIRFLQSVLQEIEV